MAFSAPAVPAAKAAPLHGLLLLRFLTAGRVRWESCVTDTSVYHCLRSAFGPLYQYKSLSAVNLCEGKLP